MFGVVKGNEFVGQGAGTDGGDEGRLRLMVRVTFWLEAR
jgi:hypothetical protein